MKKNILCLFFILLVSDIYASSNKLLNRNILQVGSSNYTQRDLEVYLLTKRVITGGSDKLISRAEWPKTLSVYKDNMLYFTVVNDESQFYGSFQPKLEYMEKRKKFFYERLKSYKKISSHIKKQGWTDRNFEEVLVQMEILKLYLTRKNIVTEKDFSFKNLESYLKEPWFKEAAAPKVYRFYEGADKYIKLEGAKF